MARHTAIDDAEGLATGAEGATARPEGNGGDKASVPIPGKGGHLLIRALLGRGDIAAALARARRAHLPDRRPDAVDVLIDLALEAGRIQLARSILAHVEGEIPPAQEAHIRARIALCDGDLQAAMAILVTAVEAQPGATLLRSLLAEVMVAAGNASDVRAVLSMLGMAPATPPIRDGSEAAQDRTGVDKRLG